MKHLKKKLWQSFFTFCERVFRVHVTRVHFYSPLPDVGELAAKQFDHVSEAVGIAFEREAQLTRLDRFAQYLGEYEPPVNSGLSRVDSLILYAMIRETRPRLVVEIGAGESTRISLAALRRNESDGVPWTMRSIEPYPRQYLREIGGNFELIEKKVQEVEPARICDADLLFIDSSHVSKIGSDVNYEIMELVPRLKVGAVVHWHDIMIPGEYPEAWIRDGNMFWNESYMVHAFMLNNEAFRVLWASKYMQLGASEELRRVFPYFDPADPGQQLSSFWVQRVR